MSTTPFEDEPNPFQSEDTFNHDDGSITPSLERLDLDGDSENHDSHSTPHQSSIDGLSTPSTPLPSQPIQRTSFPVPQQPFSNKEEYCCSRDQYLHSGDEAEILVCTHCIPVHNAPSDTITSQIVDALKTTENSTSPYITYVIQTGVRNSIKLHFTNF